MEAIGVLAPALVRPPRKLQRVIHVLEKTPSRRGIAPNEANLANVSAKKIVACRVSHFG